MRFLVALFILTGCGSGGGGASSASINQPGQQSFDWSGFYDREIAAGNFAPCPNCIKTCQPDNMTVSGWVCAYHSAQMPAGCTMTTIGTLDLNADGTNAYLWGMTLPGNIHPMGAPAINWTGISSDTMTFSTNTISLPNESFSFDLVEMDASNVVVVFSQTCAIEFARSASTQ